MHYRVFAVYDSKVAAFMPCFFVRSKGEGIRSFSDAVNQENSNFKKHAGDFTLFELGGWEDESGKFDLFPTPMSVGLAIEFVNKEGD